MIKNNKGFTLIELIVCFALITIVSLSIFKTVLSMQEKQIKNTTYNSYLSFVSVLNNTIQNDFLTDTISNVTSCGVNCFDITYLKKGIVRLEADKENNTVSYGGSVEKLPDNYEFLGWEKISGNSVLSGNTLTMGTNNTSLRAKWQPIQKIFEYTGDVQTFTVPVYGYYKVELWGAQDGSYDSVYYGGYGGYSVGNVYLNKNDNIYIVIGEAGQLIRTDDTTRVVATYNGGGAGNVRMTATANVNYMSSGGGATHISTTDRGTLNNYELHKDEVLVVASGGGGAVYYFNNIWH